MKSPGLTQVIFAGFQNFATSSGIVVILLFTSGQTAFAQTLRPKQKTIKLDIDYYWTSANYDKGGGSYESLPNGQNYSNLSLNGLARWEASTTWAWLAGIRAANAKSHGILFDRDNSGFTDASIGVQYLLYSSWFSLVPELVLNASLVSVTDTTDEVLLNEGTEFAQLGASFIARLLAIQHSFYLGYRQQGDGRASLAVGHWSGQYPLNSFYLGGQFAMTTPISKDAYSDTPFRRQFVTDLVDAGSLRYYSVNPSLSVVSLFGGLHATPQFDLSLAYNQSINGKNTAAGKSITVGFLWSFAPESQQEGSHNKRLYRPDQFQPEVEDYEKKVFRRDGPTGSAPNKELDKALEGLTD